MRIGVARVRGRQKTDESSSRPAARGSAAGGPCGSLGRPNSPGTPRSPASRWPAGLQVRRPRCSTGNAASTARRPGPPPRRPCTGTLAPSRRSLPPAPRCWTTAVGLGKLTPWELLVIAAAAPTEVRSAISGPPTSSRGSSSYHAPRRAAAGTPSSPPSQARTAGETAPPRPPGRLVTVTLPPPAPGRPARRAGRDGPEPSSASPVPQVHLGRRASQQAAPPSLSATTLVGAVASCPSPHAAPGRRCVNTPARSLPSRREPGVLIGPGDPPPAARGDPRSAGGEVQIIEALDGTGRRRLLDRARGRFDQVLATEPCRVDCWLTELAERVPGRTARVARCCSGGGAEPRDRAPLRVPAWCRAVEEARGAAERPVGRPFHRARRRPAPPGRRDGRLPARRCSSTHVVAVEVRTGHHRARLSDRRLFALFAA
jgi:hypothetical protein